MVRRRRFELIAEAARLLAEAVAIEPGLRGELHHDPALARLAG